jgi:peptidyl-tRNA hydrolase
MTPVLYILMRTDLPSMNAGKGMAQASHASNAFIHQGSTHQKAAIKEWQKETAQGFGTVLVLGATGPQVNELTAKARTLGFAADIVIDPTYPYRVTGEVASLISPNEIFENTKEYTLVRKETTCGYVFGYKEEIDASGLLKDLKLHP